MICLEKKKNSQTTKYMDVCKMTPVKKINFSVYVVACLAIEAMIFHVNAKYIDLILKKTFIGRSQGTRYGVMLKM